MATDKLVDFDHVTDYISRQAAINIVCHDDCEDCPDGGCDMYRRMKRLPAADVVARDCYDRILAENDTMREMLAGIGKKPGDKMDDVRPVVKCLECENALRYDSHKIVHCNQNGEPGYVWCKKEGCCRAEDFFCANGVSCSCGAGMREVDADGES